MPATFDKTNGMPPMIGRRLSTTEWLAYVASYDFGDVAPSRVVLHHTAIPTEAQWRGLASMQGMQRFYAGKGWTAAPHIYVGPDGVWLFTPMHDIGIHAGTGNSGKVNGKLWYSIGVEMVGYFDKARPAGAVWEQTKAVLGGLSKRLGIAPSKLISFHRDYTNQKSCPGWATMKPWVWAEVDAWLATQGAGFPREMVVRDGIDYAQVRTEPRRDANEARIGADSIRLVPGTHVTIGAQNGDFLWIANGAGFVAKDLLQ